MSPRSRHHNAPDYTCEVTISASDGGEPRAPGPAGSGLEQFVVSGVEFRESAPAQIEVQLTNRSARAGTVDAAPPTLEVIDPHGRSIGTSSRPQRSYPAVTVPRGGSVFLTLSVWLPQWAATGDYHVRFHLTSADTSERSPDYTVDVGPMNFLDGLSPHPDQLDVSVSPLERGQQ